MEPKKRAQDAQRVQELVERGMAMADRIACRVVHQTHGAIEVDDAIQIGRVALVQAAQSFDPSRGVPFEAWMARRVQGAVIDGMRQYTGLSRAEVRTHVEQRAAAQASTGTHERLRYTMRLFTEPQSQKDLQTPSDPALRFVRGEAADHLIEHHHISGPLDDPMHHNEQREALRIARQLLRDLATEERKILTDYYLRGKSFRTISASHNISRSWVSRKHKRAIEALQQQARVVMSLEMPEPSAPEFRYDPDITVQDFIHETLRAAERMRATWGVPYRMPSKYSVDCLRFYHAHSESTPTGVAPSRADG